MKIFKDRTMR